MKLLSYDCHLCNLLLDVYIGFCVRVSGCHWTDAIGLLLDVYIGFVCVCLAVIGYYWMFI